MTAVTVLGMTSGILLFGQLADRFGRKPVFLSFQVAAMVAVLAYSAASNEKTLLWMGAVMGMALNGMFAGQATLISEAYPISLRATAQNVLFNIGRVLGGTGPVVVGWLSERYSFQTAIGSRRQSTLWT